MKHKLTLLLMAIVCCFGTATSASFVNLTPRPAKITEGTGELTLTANFKVSAAATLPADMTAEIDAFIEAINATTGLNATSSQGTGLINVAQDSSLPAEGYTLKVTGNDVTLKASTPAGLFYGFQTIKKLLPANVMAGVKKDGTYALPVVEIADQPRFSYRGFMLDVSRHFFDKEQVIKMLDIMAMYKLNTFHWHLTDDQGWRLPMEKYPKLTVEGATNRDILRTDFDQQKQWSEGLDVAYGPYAYTIDDLKEVVEHARKLHINVMPEIDMPGHMVAAIHAYPEFSTDPESKIAKAAGIDMNSVPQAGKRESHFTHNIWNRGGVSQDVLDISNPKVMQFVKDVVDVLADVFPYEYIHIGGDECPTWAWEQSESCQALKAQMTEEYGLTANQATFRALQNWFTKQIGDYAAEKYGKKIMGWNELITAGGAYLPFLASTKPTIMCWVGANNAANKAETMKLPHIFTPHDGGYYINRCYRGIDQVGAVGDGSLSLTYNTNPPENEHCIGVQGTFWCEQVDRNRDLEYQALPRLLAIAEHGWTPAALMDYDHFMKRACADAEILDLAGYNYGAHQLVSIDDYETPEADKWYTLTSTATDERAGRVMELLTEGSPLLTQYSGNGAQVNRMWSNTASTDNDAQLFRFVEDPANPGHYAIVCKAAPNGSINPNPTATSVAGRWDYLPANVNYGFTLNKTYYTTNDNGFTYAIQKAGATDTYLNFSRNGQGLAINVYEKPDDGNGGIILFTEAGGADPNPPTPPVTGEVPAAGKYYRLLTRFNGDQSQPRYGSCIELLRDDAGKGGNAKADRLWSNTPAQPEAENYAYQWFTFEADPAGSGYYALVCKAKPEGSVNSTPSENLGHNSSRFDYDNSAKHYGFYLVDNINGKSTQGTDAAGFYSAITSKDATAGWYMNVSAAGQNYSVHLYNDPTDQNAGLFTFEAASEESGISEVETDQATSAHGIYDLQGRRLTETPAPGIYIINGHKAVVR